MVTKIGLLVLSDLIPIGFCLWGWMKIEVKKMDTRDELPAGTLLSESRCALSLR
jgi:hypothetical protein